MRPKRHNKSSASENIGKAFNLNEHGLHQLVLPYSPPSLVHCYTFIIHYIHKLLLPFAVCKIVEYITPCCRMLNTFNTESFSAKLCSTVPLVVINTTVYL